MTVNLEDFAEIEASIKKLGKNADAILAVWEAKSGDCWLYFGATQKRIDFDVEQTRTLRFSLLDLLFAQRDSLLIALHEKGVISEDTKLRDICGRPRFTFWPSDTTPVPSWEATPPSAADTDEIVF